MDAGGDVTATTFEWRHPLGLFHLVVVVVVVVVVVAFRLLLTHTRGSALHTR